MAALTHAEIYADALVVLGTAAVVVPLARRLGVSPVLGFLGAGALLGPLGLGSLAGGFEPLRLITVVDAKNVAGIADLGIVFLLFLIGLELSYARLAGMRRLVVGLGGLQVLLTTALLAGLLHLLGGLAGPQALVVGGALALSSTAIVLEILTRARRLNTTVGRTSISVLLAQDMAVVPLLLVITILASREDVSVLYSIVKALAQASLALAFIVVSGRLLLRPLFRLVISAQSQELFVGAVLFVIIGAGFAAGQAGLSMAIGAFVAGLLLAETEYRKAIEAAIEPVKGLLLGIFFFTIGMSIDVRELLRDPVTLASAVVGLVALKAALAASLARVFRVPAPAAVESGLLLGPGGEFAFVAIGLAVALKVVPTGVASFALAVTSISMALIPLAGLIGRRLAARLTGPAGSDPDLAVRPDEAEPHAIIVGFGRVGRVVATLMQRHGVAFIATDANPAAVRRGRAEGFPVFYGNATDPAFLRSCGIAVAPGLVITIHDRDSIDAIVANVRSLRPDVMIVSRARDAAHARHLYEVGATDAVPETVEASLQLSEAALVGLGLPIGSVIASIHEERDIVRRALQAAQGPVRP